MILRGHRTQLMADASLAELAVMAHKAEWDNDDLTAIGLMEELEVRQQRGEPTDAFRQHYMAQMRADMERQKMREILDKQMKRVRRASQRR